MYTVYISDSCFPRRQVLISHRFPIQMTQLEQQQKKKWNDRDEYDDDCLHPYTSSFDYILYNIFYNSTDVRRTSIVLIGLCPSLMRTLGHVAGATVTLCREAPAITPPIYRVTEEQLDGISNAKEMPSNLSKGKPR